MHATARATVDHGPDVSATLIRRSNDRVRVLRIDDEFVDTRICVNGEDRRPALAAIGTSVEAAIAAFAPERPLGGHEDVIRVDRIDPDLADVGGVFEPHVPPGFAAIRGLVDAIAVGDGTLCVVLAGADPHREWIVRVEHYNADGV